MQQQHIRVLLLLVAFYGCLAQNPTTPIDDWNGDPELCTVTPGSQPPPGIPMPVFPKQAEFALERVEIKHVFNLTLPSELTLYEYIYDYNANKLIIVKNTNGLIAVEYYYYEILKKSTYYAGKFCVVTDIPTNSDMDGASATQLPDGTWHIRTMNEFLLFSNNNPSPSGGQARYKRDDVSRGIPVSVWESCYINKAERRTVRRQWAFAKRDVTMPIGMVGDQAVPVQAMISASFVLPNGTRVAEVDEVYNVLSYRPFIMESTSALSPPKGVFCSSGEGQKLISLKDAGIVWPNRFSVRVETSSSRSSRWQRFHLRYNQGRESEARRLSYDYMPPGGEDYRTVVHDYDDKLTYNIDRRLGTCQITRLGEFPDVSPIRDPIEFFIKHEAKIIYDPPQNAWEFNGYRACRGNTIECAIVTTSADNFPPFVDSDTGKPTGDKWAATNFEYSWSVRGPFSRPAFNATKGFDYPVALFMRMYRFADPSNPSPLSVITEDVEYEFYEMAQDLKHTDFDISVCYRANRYEYYHVYFVLKVSKGNIIDSSLLNRRDLERRVIRNIMDATKVSYNRINDVEIDHERVSNDVTVFFTILGQTRKPEAASGVEDSEPTAKKALDDFKAVMDDENFKFDIRLEDNSTVEFKGASDSLKAAAKYMSTYASGQKIVETSYSKNAQATAIIMGTIVGLVIGVLLAAIYRFVNGRRNSQGSTGQGSTASGANPPVSFINKLSNKSATKNPINP